MGEVGKFGWVNMDRHRDSGAGSGAGRAAQINVEACFDDNVYDIIYIRLL